VSELRFTVPPELVEEIAAAVVERLGAVEPGQAAAPAWRLLTVGDVADRLGRSTRWVRERVKRGQLTRVRLDGGALAFLLEDVEAFARARRVVPLADRLEGSSNGSGDAGSQGTRLVGDRRVRGAARRPS
jgi:hypothetical protein